MKRRLREVEENLNSGGEMESGPRRWLKTARGWRRGRTEEQRSEDGVTAWVKSEQSEEWNWGWGAEEWRRREKWELRRVKSVCSGRRVRFCIFCLNFFLYIRASPFSIRASPNIARIIGLRTRFQPDLSGLKFFSLTRFF